MKPNLRLKRERELRAWSQAKVAEEVGTDPATVSRWERGLSFPYPYFRERLCTLFRKSPEELGLVQGLDEDGARSSLSGSDYLYEVNTSRSPIHDPAIPLPALLDGALVGRDELLFELSERLRSEQILPLVAMHGIPGVGKTSVAVHLAHDLGHGGACGVRQCRPCLHLLHAGLDERLDFLGRLRAALGQRAHFARHHGKAPALLSGPGGLYRGIQCQDVGLERNAVDHADDVANAA